MVLDGLIRLLISITGEIILDFIGKAKAQIILLKHPLTTQLSGLVVIVKLSEIIISNEGI